MISSYKENDVTILLKDVTSLVTPVTTEEKEKLIQSGTHYSELLQKEWVPDIPYLRTFRKVMDDFSPVIAQLIATVSAKIVHDKYENTVLISLARAGTPIGILIKRYIKARWDLDVPHYTISIIRDKGIDKNAMNYIVQRHGEKWLQFVDGWTGKGAIKHQLDESLAQYNSDTGYHVKSDLAVLSDPARVADKWGTREDILIPNACLNATISGLLSRTFLKNGIIGKNDFHGCAYYGDQKNGDYTNVFLDSVSQHFGRKDLKECMFTNNFTLKGTKYLFDEREKDCTPVEEIQEICNEFGLPSDKYCKPSIGETTRVLLRREPWKVLIREDFENCDVYEQEELRLIQKLAEEKGVEIVTYPLKNYKAVGLIKVLH